MPSQPPSVCNFMCCLKPHGIIACRTFAYLVQGSWWKGRPRLVPPPLATKQRTDKIQNQLSTIEDQQPSIIIMRVGSRPVLMSKLQCWLTRGLNYLGPADDGGQFSLATRLSRYDSVTRHIHKTTPSEPVCPTKKHSCPWYDPTSTRHSGSKFPY